MREIDCHVTENPSQMETVKFAKMMFTNNASAEEHKVAQRTNENRTRVAACEREVYEVSNESDSACKAPWYYLDSNQT